MTSPIIKLTAQSTFKQKQSRLSNSANKQSNKLSLYDKQTAIK